KDSRKTVQKYIEFLKKGEPIKKVFGTAFPVSFSDIADTLNPKTKEDKDKEKTIIDEEAIKALQSKTAKPLFRVNVRLIASAGSPFQANDILDGLTAGFSQFGSPTRNEFRIVKARNPKNIITQFIYRTFDVGQKMILSSEEITSFYHLPISSTETPRVKWLKSKEAAPPENLPKAGLLLGQSAFRGELKPVYM